MTRSHFRGMFNIPSNRYDRHCQLVFDVSNPNDRKLLTIEYRYEMEAYWHKECGRKLSWTPRSNYCRQIRNAKSEKDSQPKVIINA